MATNANAYNTRLTDEALEKRFRDTFRAQGGAELVDDLYASGVIVPVVDFTAAAEGTGLSAPLQTAWDFTSNFGTQSGAGTTTVISNSGFWKLWVQCEINFANTVNGSVNIQIFDGTDAKTFMRFTDSQANHNESFTITQETIVFLRADDIMRIASDAGFLTTITYRQIATVNGDLVNPAGFTSS